MEIQSFILAREIKKSDNNEYDASVIGAHNFFPRDGKYPLKFALPFYMLLRRGHEAHEEEITLRFDLIDSDGRSAGSPDNFRAKTMFPANHKFMTLTGTMEFNFPCPGDYRLDITADEDKLPSVYHYNIQID